MIFLWRELSQLLYIANDEDDLIMVLDWEGNAYQYGGYEGDNQYKVLIYLESNPSLKRIV